MMTYYPFTVRDSTVVNGDNRVTGLTPTVVQCKTMATPPLAISGVALPTIIEIGSGQYLATFDPEVNGEAIAQLDAGSALIRYSDRFIDLTMARDSSRIQSGISAQGQVVVGTNSDKSGYVLALSEHVNVGADLRSVLNDQGFTLARSAKLDNMDAPISSRSTYVGGDVTVGGYSAGLDPATLLFAATLPITPAAGTAGEALFLAGTRLDAAVSSRSTFDGGTVAAVIAPVIVGTNNDKTGYTITGDVTVGSYASGMDPASLVLSSPMNKIVSDVSGAVCVSMSQPVPLTNVAQTLGDALNAARAQGFGAWLFEPTSKTLKLFGADGTTVVRTFMIDNVTSPAART